MRSQSPTRPLLESADAQVSEHGLFGTSQLAATQPSYLYSNDPMMRALDVIIYQNETFLKYISIGDFFKLFLINKQYYVRLFEILNNPKMRIDEIYFTKQVLEAENLEIKEIYYEPLKTLRDERREYLQKYYIVNSLSILLSLSYAYQYIDKNITDYQLTDYLRLALYAFLFGGLFFCFIDMCRKPSPIRDHGEGMADHSERVSELTRLRKTVFSRGFFQQPSEREILFDKLKRLRPDLVPQDGKMTP